MKYLLNDSGASAVDFPTSSPFEPDHLLHQTPTLYRRTSLLAVALVTSLALACGSGGGGGAGNFNLISIEEEWQLGQQLSQDVARQVRFNNDPAVNEYVRSMGQRIDAQRGSN
jgi:predicted Zn-dependent protease